MDPLAGMDPETREVLLAIAEDADLPVEAVLVMNRDEFALWAAQARARAARVHLEADVLELYITLLEAYGAAVHEPVHQVYARAGFAGDRFPDMLQDYTDMDLQQLRREVHAAIERHGA